MCATTILSQYQAKAWLSALEVFLIVLVLTSTGGEIVGS